MDWYSSPSSTVRVNFRVCSPSSRATNSGVSKAAVSPSRSSRSGNWFFTKVAATISSSVTKLSSTRPWLTAWPYSSTSLLAVSSSKPSAPRRLATGLLSQQAEGLAVTTRAYSFPWVAGASIIPRKYSSSGKVSSQSHRVYRSQSTPLSA